MEGTSTMDSGGGSLAPAGTSLLLSIPAAELHQVSAGQQRLLERGPFSISVLEASRAPQPPTPPKPPPTQPVGKQASYPAPPTQPPGKQSLYPDVFRPPSAVSGGGGGSDSDSEGGSVAGSRIVAAVGRLAWELLPASQTLKAGQVTFVFSMPQKDVFYTVTLASDTEEEAVGMLEAILEGVTIYRESQALLGDSEAAAGEAALAERTYRSSLAQGVHRASRALATGLLATATYASGGISRGAAYLTPDQPTATPVTVSPGLKKRFRQTARVAATAASVVNSAVSGLAWAGAKVAGGVLWLAGANKPLEAGEDAGVLREVSHAAVVGFTEVWDSMEEAGRVVLLSARDNTAHVVRQRYGEEAAEVSTHGMNAAGSSAEAAFAVRKLGVKTLAKAAAKRTAKGVIHRWAGITPQPSAGGGSASASSSTSNLSSKAGTPGSRSGGNLAGSASASSLKGKSTL